MSAKGQVKKTAKAALKPGSRRYRFTKKAALTARLINARPRDIQYAEWVQRTEPFTWSAIKKLKHEPQVSIIVPVYNPPDQYFLPMVYSVVNQTYDNWELVLVNASTKAKSRRRTEDSAYIDKRIKVVDLKTNHGIAGNTNAGIEAAAGEYIGLLDHDDLLAPAALYEIVLALQSGHPASLVYSDEDKISANGEDRFGPHFKPDWSPHLLKELNYLNHFTVIKKDLLNKVGGYRTGFEGAQDYDLFLRLVDEEPVIAHVPKILYHWRTTETSTANDFSKKKNILSAGIRALEDHLERNNQAGRVTAIKKQPGFYRISYKTQSDNTVSLMIMPSPIAGQHKLLLETLLTSLKNSMPKVEIYTQKPVEPLTMTLPKNVSISYVEATRSREFIEQSLSQTQALTTIVINAAITPKTKNWVDELTAVVDQDRTIGAVTPLLINTDKKTIFDAGFVEWNNQLKPVFKGCPKGLHTYMGNTDWVRDLDAISGRCFALRSDILKAYIQSEPSSDKELYSDLCKYLKQQDLQIVLWPFARLIYRGELNPRQNQTQFFSPSLSFMKEEFGMPKTINIPPPEETND